MDETSIEIRVLQSNDECQAAADFQRDVWGRDYIDIVPGTLLHVVDYVGGLAAGAFDMSGGRNEMVGFVFGINGVRDGEIVHWSHMLGVRESARNLGLGRSLKDFQRRTLGAIGVKRIFWTFDPLMAKNAYFNLNRLGAKVVEYVPDMYGKTTSPLHLGLPTDRLIVSLETSPSTPHAPVASVANGPVLTAFPRMNDITMSVGYRSPETALIEIPNDIMDVLSRSASSARTWRLAVRDHFQWAQSRGYAVVGVHRDAESGRSYYAIARSESGALTPSVGGRPSPFSSQGVTV